MFQSKPFFSIRYIGGQIDKSEHTYDNKKVRHRRKKKSSKTIINNSVDDNIWTLYHCNIRGYNSKKDSLNTIISLVNPNMITLNEHGIKNKNKISIPGFNTYTRNRHNQNMGGVSTSTIEADKDYAIKVTEMMRLKPWNK